MTRPPLDSARGAEAARKLRSLGVTGTLIKAAELGYITEVRCGMPKCFCPEELGGAGYFAPRGSEWNDWEATFEHYPIPKVEGGRKTVDNAVLAHRLCNKLDHFIRNGMSIEKDLARVRETRERPPEANVERGEFHINPLAEEIGRRALEQLKPQPRYLIDSNVFDKLADDANVLERARRLVAAGRLLLLTTHVQLDELSEIQDSERLASLLSVPATPVPTFGFVLGTSRLGMVRFGAEQPFESIRGKNRDKYTNDALIAATAQYEGATLVTEDSTLRVRTGAEAIAVIDWSTFRARLSELEVDDDDAR